MFTVRERHLLYQASSGFRRGISCELACACVVCALHISFRGAVVCEHMLCVRSAQKGGLSLANYRVRDY